MTPVKLEPAAPRSRVKHSTTEPLRSLALHVQNVNKAKTGVVMVLITCVKRVSLNVTAQLPGRSNGLCVHLKHHLRSDVVYAISNR